MSRAARVAAVAAGVAAVPVIWLFRGDLFGPGTWGTGGNLVAWVICGTLAFGWQHLQAEARHAEQLALMTRQHKARMAQADRHHQALKDHITAARGAAP